MSAGERGSNVDDAETAGGFAAAGPGTRDEEEDVDNPAEEQDAPSEGASAHAC